MSEFGEQPEAIDDVPHSTPVKSQGLATESGHISKATPVIDENLSIPSSITELDSSNIDKVSRVFSKEVRLNKKMDDSGEATKQDTYAPYFIPGYGQDVTNEQSQSMDEDGQEDAECLEELYSELSLDVTQSSFHDEELYSDLPVDVAKASFYCELPLDITQASFYDDQPNVEDDKDSELSVFVVQTTSHYDDKLPVDVTQASSHDDDSNADNQLPQQTIGQRLFSALNEFTLFRTLIRPISMLLWGSLCSIYVVTLIIFMY